MPERTANMQPATEDDTTTTTMADSSTPTDPPSESPPSPAPTMAGSTTAPTVAQPHPQTEEMIRQVEFYFSDENLPQDAHLLSKTGEYGDGWVSINEILSFRKMRQFKPPSSVKASLQQSEKLELWNNKLIRRKEPLTVPLRVKPKVDTDREKKQTLVDKPWLSKNMLKPTGFEKDVTEGPIKPDEYEEEQKLYDPEEAFTHRIENAIIRYTSRRKMHQNTLQVFSKFLLLGGFSVGQRQFVGGISKKELEEFTKDEIAQMKAQYAISEAVLDGLDPDDAGGPTWVVDFETMAKAFLSSVFMTCFNWKNQEAVAETTNILRNFYNYVLLHNVCPEYERQILHARDLCSLAEEEFPKLAKVDSGLPGAFNIACSTLHEGSFADKQPTDPAADWYVPDDDFKGMSVKDARAVFLAGVSVHCTDAQLATVAAAATREDEGLLTISEEYIGLEVVSVEYPSGQSKAFYDRIKNTSIKSTGKLHCIFWDIPNAPPKDLSKVMRRAEKARRGKKYEFLMEEEVLRDCYPGLKLEAEVKELEIGLKWIDSFTLVYPSFYEWTLNERIGDYKEPGPPKEWQQRQNEKKGGATGQELVRHEDEEADETPD